MIPYTQHSMLCHDGRSGNKIGSAMNTETLIKPLFIDFIVDTKTSLKIPTRPGKINEKRYNQGFCVHGTTNFVATVPVRK